MALSFAQGLKLVAGAFRIVPAIIALWPQIKPIVQDISKLMDDLHADEGKGEPIAAKEFVERPHSLSPAEQNLFDRFKPE